MYDVLPVSACVCGKTAGFCVVGTYCTMDAVLVQELLDSGKTYAQISDELKRRSPSNLRGLSERSVRRFVAENNLRAVSKQNKEEALERAISEVCANSKGSHI